MSPLSISSIVVSLWLAGCLAKSTLIGWREYYGGGGVGVNDTCVEPSKREDLTQCCFNIGPPPTALDQHWNNIGSSPRVCWESRPHFDTRVPSVSGWNRLHNALCSQGLKLQFKYVTRHAKRTISCKFSKFIFFSWFDSRVVPVSLTERIFEKIFITFCFIRFLIF